MQVVVLISGRGSNLEALLEDQQNYTITHVISNNFNANGIAIAKRHGIKNTCINWRDRTAAENTLIEVIQENPVDLIVLAGFMRILSGQLVDCFHNKIINIHPSLLPKYPGLNTHQKALDNGDLMHGATVHLVDNQLDHGLILTRTQFNIGITKSANELANQLIFKEHKLLTTTMSLISSAQLTWDDENTYMQQQKQTTPLIIE